MRFCAADEPIDMFLGRFKIADPQEHRDCPHERYRQGDGVVHQCGLLDRSFSVRQRLRWIALQPQRSGKENPREIMAVEAEIALLIVSKGAFTLSCFKLCASETKIAGMSQ